MAFIHNASISTGCRLKSGSHHKYPSARKPNHEKNTREKMENSAGAIDHLKTT